MAELAGSGATRGRAQIIRLQVGAKCGDINLWFFLDEVGDAGGRPKEGGIEPLRPLFGKIAKAYLIGEAEAEFAATLGDTPHARCGALADAVTAARADARPGDVILLSPACASWDQFASFEARGDAFRALVAPFLGPDLGKEAGR